MALETTVKLSGPFLTGNPKAVIDDLLLNAQGSVGQDCLTELHTKMDQTFKNPTPYYETQVLVERMSKDLVVHDRGIVYGPWLEGVSSRNQSTRFKGYANWRRTFQECDARVPATIAADVAAAVARLQ